MEEIVCTDVQRYPNGSEVRTDYNAVGMIVAVNHRVVSEPLSGENTAFAEAVQREVSRQLREVATGCQLRARNHSGAVRAALIEVACALHAVAACDVCHGTGYDYHTMCPCSGCAPAAAAPEAAQNAPAPPIQAALLSPCCKSSTFEMDGKRVCNKCRLTRPL